jgi:hypothetical protein
LQKSPTTDKHLGVTTRGYDVQSFSELRMKAKEELETRYKKAKRDKTMKLPRFVMDDELVVTTDHFRQNKYYTLVKVVDWEVERYNNFLYYGIVLKTTSKELKNRIGRLIKFSDEKRYFVYSYANVNPEDVKWDNVR